MFILPALRVWRSIVSAQNTSDTIFILAFSIIMLNTDLRVSQSRAEEGGAVHRRLPRAKFQLTFAPRICYCMVASSVSISLIFHGIAHGPDIDEVTFPLPLLAVYIPFVS